MESGFWSQAAWVALCRSSYSVGVSIPSAERWPYVTRTEVVGEVPIAAGASLSPIGKSGQSLQGGYCSIEQGEFEKLVTEMLRS